MLDWLRPKSDGKPRIKGFDVGEHVFSGAFSNIYVSVHKKTGTKVALKVLTEAGSHIAALLERHRSTLWEGELLSVLDHPNIVKCIDYSKKPPYWIAMEYIESDVRRWVGRCNNEEEENELLQVLAQIISALRYLHEKGLVHRDICMSNMLITPDGVVKLIDFGLTIPANSSVTKGRAGTPSYMAPEMIRKWRHTQMTDVYSFGVVMYELVTGSKPFRGAMREQRMTQSLNVHPRAPSEMNRYCSEEVEDLLMRCIHKDADKRFHSAKELDSALFVIRHNRGLA